MRMEIETRLGEPVLQEWKRDGGFHAVASREDAAADSFVVEVTPVFTSVVLPDALFDVPVSRKPRAPHDERY